MHTGVLQAAGLASAVIMTALLWATAGRLGGTAAAVAVSTAFVSLCAFGHYYVNDIFNWATPYAYPATYGMVLATASLYGLLRSLDDGGTGWFAASVVCFGLTLLTKLEPAFAAGLAHAAFVAITLVRRDRAAVPLVAGYAAVLAAAAAVIGVFTLRTGSSEYDANVLSQVNVRNLGPILRYMGVSEWRTALPAVGTWSLRFAMCVALPLLLAPVVRRRRPGAVRWAAAACVAGGVASFAFAPPEQALRAVPLLVALGAGDAAVRLLRVPADRSSAVDLVLWAFALGALARLPLAAGAHHYGFYLLPVPLAAVLLSWFRRLPAVVGDDGVARRLCACTALAAVAALGWTHTRASAAMYGRHTVRVLTPHADLRLFDDVGGVPLGRIYADAVARLGQYPAQTTVLAAPEGAGLTFAAGLRTWGASRSYYPSETGPSADARLRDALEASPPGLFLLTNVLDLGHYGARGFGHDYATESVAWMQAHYTVDRAFVGNAVVIARPKEARPDAR